MTNKPKPLGVGVVGLGIGEQHAKAFAASDNCELRWLFDILRDQAETVRSRLGTGEIWALPPKPVRRAGASGEAARKGHVWARARYVLLALVAGGGAPGSRSTAAVRRSGAGPQAARRAACG